MSNVTLIATAHKEKGKCNSFELFKILHAINPDIIFEEHSPQSFIEVYEGRLPDSLETTTIKRYLMEKSVKHHPVDIDGNLLIDKNRKQSICGMLEVFDQHENYLELRELLESQTHVFGFPFLNSQRCDALLAEKYFLEQRIATDHEKDGLVGIHQTWMRIMDIRERHMLDNIYKYLKVNNSENGVFLVGAEHRRPIIDLIKHRTVDKTAKIDWHIEYFQ